MVKKVLSVSIDAELYNKIQAKKAETGAKTVSSIIEPILQGVFQ